MFLVAKDSRNWTQTKCQLSKLRGTHAQGQQALLMLFATHNLQFVLPKLLLLGLIEKGKIANMVNKDVSQDGQLRVQGGDFANVGFERGAESLERGRRIELANLPFHLVREEFALEV